MYQRHFCEYCGSEHDGTYGSGRFCSARCARKYSYQHITEESKARQVKALNDPKNRQKIADIRYQKSLERKEKLESTPRSINPITDKYGKGSFNVKLGTIGELRTIEEFGRHNIQVFRPVFNDSNTDLIVELNGQLKKIQVKSSATITDDKSSFDLRSSNIRYTKDGDQRGRTEIYSSDDIDYFALYDFNDDEVYLMKNPEQQTISLRNNKPKSHNGHSIKYKEDFKLDNIINLLNSGIDPDSIISTD